MADVVIVDEAPEVVISLAATLETPNEPETEVKEVTEDGEVAAVVVEKAEEVVEQKIADAKEAGASIADINELRGLLRELRNDNISLQARLTAAERVQNGEFGKDGSDEDVTELEKYQAVLSETTKRDFSELVAVMEVNPKYEDLAEVCSKSHFDDIFEKVAAHRSSENGSNFNVELVKVKSEVWSLPNPYKYMYEAIREYHEDYAKPVEKETVAKPAITAKEIVAKKVVTAPGTVANLGGGDETKGGWTAEKLDNMPEDKLHTVPKDVYKKWLAGDLD